MKGGAARGKHIRAALGIVEKNPLKNRELRNYMEHFDEKLDRYLDGSIVGHLLPQYIGLLPESTGVPVHFFRAYYIDIGIFEILGNRYEVEPIAHEILRIHELLEHCDRNGGRLLPLGSPN